MKLIKFPIVSEMLVEHHMDGAQPKMYIGPFSITCPCGSVSHLDPQNMIFKSMEFYCTACGQAHKVSNPALSCVPTRPSR